MSQDGTDPNELLDPSDPAPWEPSMTPIPPIPEDLKVLYADALDAHAYADSRQRANEVKYLIERIAKLTAERDEFERKGKELCSAYGNALVTIHDLKALAGDVFIHAKHSKPQWGRDDFLLELASRATRTPPQEGQ